MDIEKKTRQEGIDNPLNLRKKKGKTRTQVGSLRTCSTSQQTVLLLPTWHISHVKLYYPITLQEPN